jgi:hypothetical protein
MFDPQRTPPEDVDQLLRNAELRDELERYLDESISRVNVQHLPLAAENEFLASMLAWEQAPVLPIYRWFESELRLPRPEMLSDDDLHQILWDVIYKLYEKHIVLDFTEHLSDRQLYCLILRDILPAREKKLDSPSNWLHWDCTGPAGDPDIWLMYYASDEERDDWAETYHQPVPPRKLPPYPRHLPQEPV